MASPELDKVRRLTTVPDQFLAKIPKAERQVYDMVVQLLARLEVRNGQYVISNRNLTIASEISQLLREVLLGSDYVKYVGEFAKEFDDQAVINNRLFEKAFPAYVPSELGKQVVNIAKRDAIDLLLNRASDSDFVAPLREVIEQSVINGAGYRETLDSIRTFIEGNDEVDGALLKYSKQIAHDSYAIADASYTSIVSEELDAEWFKYSGDEIASTRPFCAERDNQFYHYKEIEAWGAGETSLGRNGTNERMQWPKSGTWAGRIPETTAATIYSYRGGFQCRHSIMPVSLFAVPPEVIQRNIDSGNYVPTEKEKELLDLPKPTEDAKQPTKAEPTKSEFKPVTNISEGTDRLSKAGVSEIAIEKMDLSHVNAMVEVVENVPKKAVPDFFGSGSDYNKLIASDTNKSTYRLLKISRPPEQWHGVSLKFETFDKKNFKFVNKNLVAINTEQYKTVESMTARRLIVNENYKSKFNTDYYFNTDGRLVHYHEVGHAFDNATLRLSGKPEWLELSAKWYKETKTAVLKSPSEAFAEAFADYYGNNAARVPDYIKAFFDKYKD